jgi:hypothetical protein
MLYQRDRQVQVLSEKLDLYKQQLSRTVNTKVFAQANSLVHELDLSQRQLRHLKDNLFKLEDMLTEKIRLNFDTDLNTARN